MLGKRLIKSNNAGAGACTNTVDLYNPFPDGGGVALYQLNGDATDVSGNYNGTATNVTYGAGQFGQAGVFNGSSSYIDSNLNCNVTNVTYSFWFNIPSKPTDTRVFIGAQSTGSSGMIIALRGSNSTLAVLMSGQSLFSEIPYASFSTNTWHNIVASINSTNVYLYLDGSLIDSKGTVTSPQTRDFYIGANNDVGTALNHLNGSIDQVRIFSRALRPYEVEALYTEEYCTPTIVPSEHFNTVTYTGNGSDGLAVTGTGFSPDFVWIKPRTQADNNNIYDTLRGVRQQLITNNTSAESTQSRTLQSFDSDGFTLNDDNNVNNPGIEYVSWNFKAGGAAVTNTDGTITSQVSANTEAGFSVVSYTGNGVIPSTYGHGLDTTPKVVIVKNRDASSDWTFNFDLTPTDALFGQLNNTSAMPRSTWMGGTDSVVSMLFENGNLQNANGNDYIAYCFAEVEGFSNFGSYVGTGTTSGNVVVTGFEPAFVMVKRTDASGNSWLMVDNKRVAAGNEKHELFANTSTAESGTGYDVAFLENGFQMQTTTSNANASGASYIYMAFAADPTAVEPTLEDSFNTVLYTSTGGSQSITGLGFQPDLLWTKNRTSTWFHQIVDSVRLAPNTIYSNSTQAESTPVSYTSSLDTDGFTVNYTETIGSNYVAWAWKGAEIPAINSNGSIPSVVSANPAAGFSIVSWASTSTTSTIGHGLESTPSIIIMKSRTNAGDWQVYSSAIGATQKLFLNNTNAATSSGVWGNTSPNESVFTSAFNNVGNVIAYCFAEVAGFSKFGSYTGNGSTNGPTIDCGFEPAFVMIKSTTQTGSWRIWDNKRSPSNPRNEILKPNESEAEETNSPNAVIDFLENGFQAKSTHSSVNTNGASYIYMAFANQF